MSYYVAKMMVPTKRNSGYLNIMLKNHKSWIMGIIPEVVFRKMVYNCFSFTAVTVNKIFDMKSTAQVPDGKIVDPV